ncbi:MAG: carboxypeptidase-like regulatory domain-containing protein [Bacteroidota bacterium]
MKKKITLSVILSILFSISSLLAQKKVIGILKDFDTKEPIPCANVELSSNDSDLFTTTHTHDNGSFFFENVESDNYCLAFYHSDYRSFDTCFVEASKNSDTLIIYVYSYESKSYRIKDVAKEDNFDYSILYNVYSPITNKSENQFKSTFSIQFYNLNAHIKLANKLQLGFKITPIDLTWYVLSSPDSLYIKERYFGASGALFCYLRYIPTTTKSLGSRGLFIDIGAGYNIPYYFSYSRFIDKYNRLSTRNIKQYNDFQAMLRFGYSWGAICATYHLTDVMKDSYIELPKLTLGIELFIPFSR